MRGGIAKTRSRSRSRSIGNSPAENALKAALCTMLDGDMHNGKTIMLDHIKSVLPLKTCGKKINCFGSEYSNFLQIFIHIWKLS